MEKNKLLWQKAGLSAVTIKKQYDDAKEEYKGKKMNVAPARGACDRHKSAPWNRHLDLKIAVYY